jgi:hypothetical protein
MTVPVVLMQDAEQYMAGYVRDLIAATPQLAGYKVGTTVAAGTTPKLYVQVRKIGGTEDQGLNERARVDLRVWGDNQPGGDYERMQTARVILAHIRRDLNPPVMAVPVNLPDPADQTVMHTLFTIEPTLRGVQQ